MDGLPVAQAPVSEAHPHGRFDSGGRTLHKREADRAKAYRYSHGHNAFGVDCADSRAKRFIRIRLDHGVQGWLRSDLQQADHAYQWRQFFANDALHVVEFARHDAAAQSPAENVIYPAIAVCRASNAQSGEFDSLVEALVEHPSDDYAIAIAWISPKRVPAIDDQGGARHVARSIARQVYRERTEVFRRAVIA